MNKRGQVFILAAILLAVILFSLGAIRNKFQQKQMKGDFEALSENYKMEASKLINSVLKQPEIDPHEAFKSFSTMFTSYAKGKNPEYGLIYILSFEDRIQVTNFLDRTINVLGCGLGGASYNVTIPGGFGKINANLDFEGFKIDIDEAPAGLEFDCQNISLGLEECTDMDSLHGDITTPENNGKYCAFLCLGGSDEEKKIAVMIDDATYKLCVQKGVPEIMQVGIMKQGEQAKVSATGDCMGQDFCGGLDKTQCSGCGKDVCFWWELPPGLPCSGLSGACLSKYTYSNRDPSTGGCPPSCDKICVGDRVFYEDSCVPPNPIVVAPNGDCEADQRVCLSTPYVSEAQCCTKNDEKKCHENDLYYYDTCDVDGDVLTGIVADDCTRHCDAGTNTCCNKQTGQVCDGDSICSYWDNCGYKEDCTACTTGRHCNAGTNTCCNKQTGQVCSNDFTKICDYYDDCGYKEDCNIDCSKNNKECVCTAGTCKCKPKTIVGWTYTCRKYTTETKCDDCPSCPDDWTSSGGCLDSGDCNCNWLGDCDTEYAQTCYKDYPTDCSKSPSPSPCPEGDKVGEASCLIYLS